MFECYLVLNAPSLAGKVCLSVSLTAQVRVASVVPRGADVSCTGWLVDSLSCLETHSLQSK